MRISKRYLILVFGLAIFGYGCHRTKNAIPETMLSGTGVISADEALMPLVNAELDVFHSLYNSSSINCKFGSEYDAINLLLQEKVRLAIVTRSLNQKEIDFFKSKDIVPQSIPLAYDGIALVVHPENKIKVLSIGQISKILSGNISDWTQIENSGRTGNIQLVFDSESSGIIRYLNDKLKLNKKISGDIKFSGNSKNITEMVAANPNAIGFIGYNWLSEIENIKVQRTLETVNLIAVSNSLNNDITNSFMPSISTLYDSVYPLMRQVYAIYTDPSASLSRGFLAHLTCDRGQKIIYRCGLKPENDFQRLIKIKNDY